METPPASTHSKNSNYFATYFNEVQKHMQKMQDEANPKTIPTDLHAKILQSKFKKYIVIFSIFC